MTSYLGDAELIALLRAFEGPDQPETGLRVVDDIAAKSVGHGLFTVMVLHRDAMQVQRIYSNRPDVYPVGGRKEKRDTPWARQVIDKATPFLGRDAEAIREHFDDHQTIADMGLASILNMPVIYDGVVLGTMNLLHSEGHYSQNDITAAGILANALLPPLCALQMPPAS